MTELLKLAALLVFGVLVTPALFGGLGVGGWLFASRLLGSYLIALIIPAFDAELMPSETAMIEVVRRVLARRRLRQAGDAP